MSRISLSLALLTAACTPVHGELPAPEDEAWPTDLPSHPGGVDRAASPDATTAEPTPPGQLEITFMAVGGYLIRYGDDAVMTPPMYTNPNLLETTLFDVRSEPATVEQFSSAHDLSDVKAILVGHAHYDHLLDAPTLWPRTDDATFYGNATMGHLLAAHAPDRGPECAGTQPQAIEIPRDRVVSLNDPLGELGRDYVDYRHCPNLDPGYDNGEGDWVHVDDSQIRFRALCSRHPAQFGPIHFGPGSLDEDVCRPPDNADDWVEGTTLSYLIDFLDPVTGEPVHRVYYQDAPTGGATGLFDPDLLDDKAVDVALMNVGSFDGVADFPEEPLRMIEPRYSIGGHWEDFFRTLAWPIVPLLGHDIDDYASRAAMAMTGEEPEVLVDDVLSAERQWVPLPGTQFSFLPED